MAWKYRQRFSEEGDAVIPEDWIASQNEFASEFNGYLDRDNFGENAFSSNTAVLVANSFNKVKSAVAATGSSSADYGSSNVLDADIKSSGYTGEAFTYGTTTKTDVSKVSLSGSDELKTGALLICEFSCTWGWHNAKEKFFDGTTGAVNTAVLMEREQFTQEDLSITRFGVEKMDACIRWRLTADGMVVSESGWFSNARQCANVYLVGAVPAEAGVHTVQAEYRIAYVDRFNEFLEKGDVKRYCEIWDRELVVHARKR